MSGILQKGARRFTTQIGAAGVPDAVATTIPLVSTTGLPTDTEIEVIIDRTDGSGILTPSKEEVVRGTVSGLNLINCIRGVEGTAQAHGAGATVNSFLTASMWNNVIDYIRDTPSRGLIGGVINVSVASNNLTVAVKTLQGTDPSATNPVGIWIGNQLRWITSALSITANGGTNYLGLGATELQTQTNNLFVYLQWNTTTNSLNFLLSKYCHARKMSIFTNSNTNEKGAIGIVNYNSNDDVVLVDRFDAILNASNNWTSAGNVYGQPILETDWLTFEGSIYGGTTKWTKGNGSTQCRYKIIGNTITVTHLITIGSTSSIPATSTIHLDAPFGVASNFASVGAGWVQNSGDVNGAYTMSWRMGWGDASNRGILGYTGTRVTNIAPLAFGTDDQVGATITYQI
jgi:hypothetical protein